MNYKALIEAFSQNQKPFKIGAKILREEAINNGYKTNLVGLQTFLNNCEMGAEMDMFYQLCIPFAIDNK